MKKQRVWIKLVLDLVLLILLALMYRKRAIGMRFHEWGGLALFGLFLIHKALNWQWIRGVTAAIFRGKAKWNARWTVDVLLLMAMTAVAVTGLLISKTLPTAIAGARGIAAWHYFFAASTLVLSGIHLGLHGTYLKSLLWDKLPVPAGVRKALGVGLLCVLFCFGSVQLVSSGFAAHFMRPFVTMSGFPAGEPVAFAQPQDETHGHGQEREGRGMGNGPGNGMGKGQGMGQGMGKNGMEPGSSGFSFAEAISTCTTYGAILGWFAIATGVGQYGISRKRGR